MVNVDTDYTSIQEFAQHKMCSVYVNEFTEKSARNFYAEFMTACSSGQTIVPIMIDSYGGYLYALNFMIDTIDSRPKEIAVATIAIGKAMSAGAVLLTCGDEGCRFAAPNASIMIHHVGGGTWGKTPDLVVDIKEQERLEKQMFQRMATNCGQPKNYFLDRLKQMGNVDWYLTAKEAKKYHVIDHIRIPELHTAVGILNELA